MASTPKMEYKVFISIFQKNTAMATLSLKEMGKFLWEGRGKSLPSLLSQFSFAKLKEPTGPGRPFSINFVNLSWIVEIVQ